MTALALALTLLAPDAPTLLVIPLVIPLRAKAALSDSAEALDEMLLQAIHDRGGFAAIGQDDLNAMLGVEQMKDAMGCDDVSCAAEIGGALGAPYLLSGKLSPFGKDQIVLSLRLIDTQKARVLGRATVRGENSGESMVSMLAKAVQKSFAKAKPATTTAASGAGPNDYSEYTRILTDIGKLMSALDYSQILADLDRYEKMKINSPPNTDVKEYLVYYRVIACEQLRRRACVERTAADYNERWPAGMYSGAVQSTVERWKDADLAREDATADLNNKLAEITALHHSGKLDARTKSERQAYAYLRAKRWAQSEAAFRLALDGVKEHNKAMQLLQGMGVAMEQAGRFDALRALLAAAEKRDAKAFRRAGLHHTARRLPK